MGLVGPAGVAPVATPASRLMALSVHLRRLASPLQRYVASSRSRACRRSRCSSCSRVGTSSGAIDVSPRAASPRSRCCGEFVRIRVFRRSAEGELTLSTAFSFAVLLDGGRACRLHRARASRASRPTWRAQVGGAGLVQRGAVRALDGGRVDHPLGRSAACRSGTVEPFVASELPSMVIARGALLRASTACSSPP